jgi:hypothetical protein
MTTRKGSDNRFPLVRILRDADTPDTPPAGEIHLRVDDDGLIYTVDEDDNIVMLGAAGGSVATDAIYNAKGDLPVGTGADTAARLGVGTNGHVLTADSGETTGIKWAAAAGGLGAWTSYTPTWTASTTNPTIGNGTLQGYYKALDASTYLVEISLVLGSTTSIGSGTYSFALPATAAAAPGRQVLAGYFLNAGTAFYVAAGQIAAGTATVALVVIAESGGTRIWTSGNPNVLGQDDELALSGILKV